MPDKRNTDFKDIIITIFKKLPLEIVVANLFKKCKFWFTNRIGHYNEDNWYVHCNMLRLWENEQLIGAYRNIQNIRYDSSTSSKNGLCSSGIIQSAAIVILDKCLSSAQM